MARQESLVRGHVSTNGERLVAAIGTLMTMRSRSAQNTQGSPDVPLVTESTEKQRP